MTIRLTVDRARWWRHVTDVAAGITGLVPVVKGNGYGFGRAELALVASELSPLLAIGTIHEREGLPDSITPIVLTPTLQPPADDRPVLTVGHREHVEALRNWGGRVIVKLDSDMHRYGNGISLVADAQRAGLRTVGVAIHPPLAGSDEDHREQIVRRLPEIDPSLDVWVSHLAPDTFDSLPDTHRYKLRLGTYLWHGDRGAMRLEADVLDTKWVRGGTRVGYRQTEVDRDGTLLMVGAGTANGVAPLDDGRSPFHYRQERLPLVEAPHMHTSMLYVAPGRATPRIGDWIDLQRPLTTTTVDELRWD